MGKFTGFDIYMEIDASSQSGYGHPDVAALAGELLNTFPVVGETLYNTIKEELTPVTMVLPFKDKTQLVVEMNLTILQGGIKIDWKINEDRSDSPRDRDAWGVLNAISQYAYAIKSDRHLENWEELVLARHITQHGEIIIGQTTLKGETPLFYAKALMRHNSVCLLLHCIKSQDCTKEEYARLELEAALVVLISLPELYKPI